MDCSTKVTIENVSDQQHHSETQTDAASTSSVEQSDGSYPCPACSLVLTSSRELTSHLRGHNSPRSTDCSGEEDYSCGVCHKVLSSASSLDRHVLVHSGERPFKCKYCDMAFTTNGNMNRHLRTAHRETSPHSFADSEGSSDSERPTTHGHVEEYNNNEVSKRSSPDLIDEGDSPSSRTKRKRPDFYDEFENRRRHKILLRNSVNEMRIKETRKAIYSCCPICREGEFEDQSMMENHVETYHPNFVLEHGVYIESLQNHRAINLQRQAARFSDRTLAGKTLRSSVVGFRDLTFMDFSADKFPAIARAVCEQSLHRPASGEIATFQCTKCHRAFPCKSALDSHEIDCGSSNHTSINMQEDQSKRNYFFAGLDLQNKAVMKEAKEGKDLADIQSILSIASNPVFPRSDRSTPDNQIKINPNVYSSGSSGNISSEVNEEETQDAFATEFRKMKLKGEFPCRLCPQIFPNLRALKGHNRAHMGVPSGMPYPCNMCSYSSPDKTTVIRHLRSHNGDRPYECSMCNYAFTTKANCERHVRNRHGKLTRDEIKSVLIYHPNEDSTNEGIDTNKSSPRVVRDDAKKNLNYPSDREDSMNHQMETKPQDLMGISEEHRLRQLALAMRATPVSHYDRTEIYPRSSIHLDSSRASEGFNNNNNNHHESIKSEGSRMHDDDDDNDDDESRSSEGSASLVSETKSEHQRVQASPNDLESNQDCGEETPLDLSMDVLDLSKKSKENGTIGQSTGDGDIERNNTDLYDATNQLLLTQALLKAGHSGNIPTSLEALYANAHLLYRNFTGFNPAAVPPGILPPYLFNPHLFGQDFAMRDRLQKELVRGLQLTSGGTLVEPPNNQTNFPSAYSPARDLVTRQIDEQQQDYSKLIASNIPTKISSPRDKIESSPSSNSVKMVIKNGVLMPKQKQRRYRTERPFTCEHCSAKFTLRSNMERHIKQQHPQFWSQRPRGGHSTRGRPPANPPILLQNVEHSSSSHQQNYQNIVPKVEQSEYEKHQISDQVKYAILAQQLKANKHEDIESEEELIIDENAGDKEIDKNDTERPTSLLRGKLEEKKTNMAVDFPEKMAEEGPSTSALKKESENKIDENSAEIERKEDDDKTMIKSEDGNADLASVSELLDNASQQYQQFQPQYMSDEEGLVASTSDCNNSGSDDKSDSVNSGISENSSSSKLAKKKKKKKKSAYSMAPNRVICPYCQRAFPWTSSLRRHILTHTGQKPYRCEHCSLLFTTKSNCDRHLLRKHKANPNKVRKNLTSLSPEAQEIPTTNNNTFSMRNVPERPYKCDQCPSSTFSTVGNLKKHKSSKHSNGEKSRPESPTSEPNSENQNSPPGQSNKQNDQSGYDTQTSSISDNVENAAAIPEVSNIIAENLPLVNQRARSRRPSPRGSPGPSDTPFKCHLCDCGFSERFGVLEHIKKYHKKTYVTLVNKGAYDLDFENLEGEQPASCSQRARYREERRGRFPDYRNRKVVCAFCMRRFWSAEDLRRHMRTHTGEKPYTCAICLRKFTLKHSMIRHRRKHESVDSAMYVGTSGDEENPQNQPPTSIPHTHQPGMILSSVSTGDSRIHERNSLPTVASVATGDAAPNNLMRYNPYETRTTLTNTLTNQQNINSDPTPDNDNDLISNLLGLRDRSIIEQALQASVADAAKLLGVSRNQD